METEQPTPPQLAQLILDRVAAAPTRFGMDAWARFPGLRLKPGDDCATTLCVAGWAAHLTGWSLERHPDGETTEATSTRVDGRAVAVYTDIWAERDGERRTIPDVAREALGLGHDESDRLFHNTNAGARTALEALAAGTR